MNAVVFGLGRIGLPIALVCAHKGYKIIGVDTNKKLVDKLRKNEIPFFEKDLKELLSKNLNNNFIPKHGEDEIIDDVKQAKYIMIAVGTGFAKYPKSPNLFTLHSIIGQLISIGIKGKTLILRVTLPIGTSDEIISVIEKKTGMKEGRDFWFGFVPERIMEGKAIEEEQNLPKIIGCYNDKGYEKVSSFFKKIGGENIRVSNPKTAEFIKLIDNSWRNTRFAFANELAFLGEKHGIDVLKTISSANKGYERNEIPSPGPVSGYCLGKDPYLLELAFDEIAKKRGFNSVWYYGRLANDWFVKKIIEEIEGNKILVAGLSFKENIDDYRYSHSIEIVRRLINKGLKVTVCDPYLDNNYYTTLPDDIRDKVDSYKSIIDALSGKMDTIIFSTKNSDFSSQRVKKIVNKLSVSVKIIDLWNIFSNKK